MNPRYTAQFVTLLIIWSVLVIRLTYFSTINLSPGEEMLFAPLCGVDAHLYDGYGQALASGQWPGSEPLFRTPLYTLFLGGSYLAFGLNHLAPLIVQALLHTLTAAGLYTIGRRVHSRWAGWLAAAGFAAYGSLIFYSGCFAQISLVVPLLTLSLAFLLRFETAFSPKYLALAGLLVGLATIGRPTVAIVTLPALIWLGRLPGRRIRWFIAFVLPIGLAIVPFTAFNYWVSGRFIPISANGPEVLFISNNPDAEGRDILAPGVVLPVHKRLEQVVQRIGRDETTFVQEVISYIVTDPLDWLALQANKLRLLFLKPDLNLLTVAFAYPTTPQQIAVFSWFPVQWYGLLLAALIAMMLHPTRFWLLLVGTFISLTLATLLFFVQLRFRLLLGPIVLLYAAIFLAQSPRWFQQQPRYFFGSLALFLLTVPFTAGGWLFVIGLLGIGAWQLMQHSLQRSKLSLLVGGWAIFVLFLLTGQIYQSARAMSQSEDYYLGPQISGAVWLGQTFQATCNGLSQLEFTLYAQQQTPLTFRLISETTGETMFSQTFTPSELAQRTHQRFTFTPIPNSRGQRFLAYFTAPDAHPTPDLTVRGFSSIPVDWYPDGQAVVGQDAVRRSLPADLAFRARCHESFFALVQRTFAKSPVVYWGLFISHTILLLAASSILIHRTVTSSISKI